MAKMSPISGPLEALPPEVRRHLLTMMEFNELRALVRASPLYHEQYLLERQWLLSQCVDKLLGSVNIEASLVCQSSTAGFAQTRTRESITSPLNHTNIIKICLASLLSKKAFLWMISSGSYSFTPRLSCL